MKKQTTPQNKPTMTILFSVRAKHNIPALYTANITSIILTINRFST